MADQCPTKSDIQTIFKRLRSISTNKICFDCNSKNPTWSSVTYGVFICIDCSAVHRSLGVHLTFVRSTQLDTNWTWLQLRQMQLGGNANASVFFRQHNCNTTDAQQKYTSRAAQLYKEKLHQLAVQAMKLHGTQLHLESNQEKPAKENAEKEFDFFEEHVTFSNIPTKNIDEQQQDTHFKQSVTSNTMTTEAASLSGPSVNLMSSGAITSERKSMIGGRKPAAKKPGLGGRKTGGLGAQKVKANFAEIEREAELQDELKEREAEEAKKTAEKQTEDEEKKMVSMRLAYKDLSLQQRKEEEKLKQIDPKKAEQIERLGMGFATKSGVSHSALDDMKVIENDALIKLPQTAALKSTSNYDNEMNDNIFDEYVFDTPNYGMYRSMPISEKSLTSDNHSRDRSSRDTDQGWTFIDSDHAGGEKSYKKPEPIKPKREIPPANILPEYGEAQKKFGNAKSISSDQYFADSSANKWETKMNLSRFEGASSISSDDFFDDGTGRSQRSMNRPGISTSISAPDLEDIRESVRQGVTKVAGKISSLANGVMSSIQDRYGY